MKEDKILFLGTGAADWNLDEKGSFFRRNSAVLINSELIIDCGEHIFDFSKSINSDDLYNNVTDIIITHNHCDHFSKESVLKLAEIQRIRVGCDREIMNIIGDHPNIEFVLFVPYKEQKIGRYKVVPLLANHSIVMDGDSCAFHYIIHTPNKKTIFYGLDGAWFLRPSWEIMKQYRFNIMILDCTVGDCNDWRLCEHNTIPMLRIMLEGIKVSGMLHQNGRVIASHLSRSLHSSYEKTRSMLEKIDIITAYDGMNIEF